MPSKFGIMQGRLVPPEDGRFQSFPRRRWRDEFPNAVASGIDYIEWIVDAYGEDVNPILRSDGLAEFLDLKAQYNIATYGICADWFMDYPFLRCNAVQRKDREQFLHALIPVASRISANYIVLPFVDISRIESAHEQDTVVDILTNAAPIAAAHKIELHLETDLAPSELAALIGRIPHPFIKVNYDSGNSSGLGYLAAEEFAAYGGRIGSIHIKDRRSRFDGGIATMPLGQGSANLHSVFACMKQINYTRPVTLQVARGVDGDEVHWIREQLAVVKQYWQ